MIEQNKSTVWILGSGGLIGTSFSNRIAKWPVEQVRLRHSSVNAPSIHETAVGFDVYLDVDARSHLDWISRENRLPNPSEIVLLGWGNVRNPHHASHTSISPLSVVQMAEVSILLGAKRVIFAGSIDEYSGAAGRRHEDRELPDPMNSYVAGKIRAHEALERLCRAHNVQNVHCRISSVYGPTKVNVGGSLVQTLWEAHVQGVPAVLGDCETWRDHVYVEDVSEDIRLLLFSDLVGTFNVGFGTPTQVRQLAESLWVAFGETLETLRFGGDTDLAVIKDSPDWYLDVGRMNALAGSRHRYDLGAGSHETSRILKGIDIQIR